MLEKVEGSHASRCSLLSDVLYIFIFIHYKIHKSIIKYIVVLQHYKYLYGMATISIPESIALLT